MANKNQYIATSLLLIVVLIAGYFGIKLPNPGVPEPLPYVVVEDGAGGVGTRSAIGRAIQFDRNVRLAQDLAVVGDVAVTGAQTVGGALTVTGAITGDGAVALASTLTVTGTLTSTGFVAYSPEGAVTVTAGSTITPTGTYQVISSGGAVTCSTTTCVADADTPGTLLILYNNNASDTITIDGTGGNVECKTDIVLGPRDTILLIWNATDWVCLANHDN